MKTYFHIPIFIIWRVKDYKERNNLILNTTFVNASFQHQNAFEKCATKTGLCNGKSYTLDCYCIVTHINAASFSIKNHFMWKYQHCFSNNYWKLGKINAKLNSFWNFVYVSNYLLLFDFCMETRLSNILKTTNVTNFTKTILESSYRVLQVTLR